MKRILALVCVGVLAICVPIRSTDASNTSPLAFGMTPDDVATALGVPLDYVAGRPGNEVYIADVDARVPGYPVGSHIFLQFRRGALTGWKTDTRLRKRWLFF